MAALNKLEELNSFIRKFSTLWAAGSNASLVFESVAGQAFVTLRLGLGEYSSTLRDTANGVKKKRMSPSKLRRRDRRAAERIAAETSKIEAEKPTPSEVDAKVDHAIVADQEENNTITEKVQKSSNTVNMNVEKVNDMLCKPHIRKGDMKDTEAEEAVLEEPVAERSLWAKSHADPRKNRGTQLNHEPG